MARQTVGAAAALATAAVVATVTAGSAAAYDLPDTPSLPYTFDGAATLTVGPSHQRVVFPTATVNAFTNVAEFTGTFAPPPTTAAVGGMQYSIAIVNPSQIAGTAVATTPGSASYTLTATQTFAVRVTGMTLAGGTGSAGLPTVPTSGTCTTPPVTATVTGTIDAPALLTDNPSLTTTLTGPVTIPAFGDCGPLTPIVTAAISGAGNTYSVGLSNAKRGSIQE
ncbi:hypothetical protein GCM10009722_31560 [Williamsia deligens]